MPDDEEEEAGDQGREDQERGHGHERGLVGRVGGARRDRDAHRSEHRRGYVLWAGNRAPVATDHCDQQAEDGRAKQHHADALYDKPRKRPAEDDGRDGKAIEDHDRGDDPGGDQRTRKLGRQEIAPELGQKGHWTDAGNLHRTRHSRSARTASLNNRLETCRRLAFTASPLASGGRRRRTRRSEWTPAGLEYGVNWRTSSARGPGTILRPEPTGRDRFMDGNLERTIQEVGNCAVSAADPSTPMRQLGGGQGACPTPPLSFSRADDRAADPVGLWGTPADRPGLRFPVPHRLAGSRSGGPLASQAFLQSV